MKQSDSLEQTKITGEDLIAIKRDLQSTRVVEGHASTLDSLDQLMSVEAVNSSTLSPPVATPNVDATVLMFPDGMQVILNHPFKAVVAFLGLTFFTPGSWE